MRILKSTRSAFERQILESVLIQKERKKHHLLNAKAEYNRCALPRLTAKLGDKDLEKWREEDRAEMAKESSIEEKIRVRKKAKAKERASRSRRMEQGQPAKKKRRIHQQEGDEQAQDQGDEEESEKLKERAIPTESPNKRKNQRDEQKE